MNLVVFGKKFLLSCQCCNNPYQLNQVDCNNSSPILLDCGHSFCYMCYKQLQKNVQYQFLNHFEQKKIDKPDYQVECSICDSFFLTKTPIQSQINYQLISFCKNKNLRCEYCQDVFKQNNLPYFKKRNMEVKKNYNTIQTKFPEIALNDQTESKLKCKKCFCLDDQKNIAENQAFSIIFIGLNELVCNRNDCYLYMTENFIEICDCYYKNLSSNDKQKILDEKTSVQIRTELQEDFQKLKKIYKTYEKFTEQFLHPSQHSILYYNKIYNNTWWNLLIKSFCSLNQDYKIEDTQGIIYKHLWKQSKFYLEFQTNRLDKKSIEIIKNTKKLKKDDLLNVCEMIKINQAFKKIFMEIYQNKNILLNQIEQLQDFSIFKQLNYPKSVQNLVECEIKEILKQKQVDMKKLMNKFTRLLSQIKFFKISEYYNNFENKIKKKKKIKKFKKSFQYVSCGAAILIFTLWTVLNS